MTQTSSQEIIENIKKAGLYYQEIMMQLLKQDPHQYVANFYSPEKSQEVATRIVEQFFGNPEKFTSINLEYAHNLQKLIADTVNQFAGKNTDKLFEPLGQDRRFKDPAWQQNFYFDFISKYYLLSADWLKKTVQEYDLDHEGKRIVQFLSQQFVDALSPSNFVFSNPEVIRESLESGMQNLAKGMENFLQDIKKSGGLFNITTTDTSRFEIGVNIATTPGKVIFQNDLMQLICYEPKKQSFQIPIFVIPPWINKYYILDLSENNSMIKWLVDNNFQVFLVSWVNPGKQLANKDFADYLKEGVLEPLAHIEKLGFEKVNAIGYCIGGTLLSIALSYLRTIEKPVINSATFLTTLLDFANPGEIGAFINKSTISFIEQKVEEIGYLDGKYLSNSFSLIRANDLVWSYFVNNYLLGKSPAAFDILFWNADATNLTAKMYIYYLKNMYINNLLKEPNTLEFFGKKINLTNIDVPSFSLAAKSDHIALWQSVYDSMRLLSGDKTFCLTDAGHVAGVVNPATNLKYSHMLSNNVDQNANEWLNNAKIQPGSWWNSWQKWLGDKSGNLQQSLDYNKLEYLELAPGSYVKKCTAPAFADTPAANRHAEEPRSC